MLTFSLGIYVLSQLINFRCTDALQCYNCSNIVDTDECLTVTKCLAGQSCYQNKRMSDQTTSLGCIENMQCGVLTNGGAGSLIGRSLGSRQVHDCHECCSTDTCNKNLCNHLKPSVCIDDVKFDCALLNTVVNICQDIQHAKTVCPSFCGLCALVDGNWATWSLWSACDVTCENGTQSRTRTCTDPAPAGGGLDCSGSSIETKTCLKELCPDALQCYNCSNIVVTDECSAVAECLAGQSCYQDTRASGQTKTLGCIDNMQCGVHASGAGSLVGRSLSSRQVQDCHECCSTDKCNKNLCNHQKPTVCIDDVKFDCALLNTVFNICQDIHRAKTVCPKFCGLCSLVDGNWATWSDWSACDVTCENGTQTRTRTCTDPAPANGGLDCSGTSSEIKICLKEPCPIHGGWTKGSGWEACSVTCGVGIERRHRNCSNPVSDRFGHHCFGDTLDDRTCLPGPCANGGWSDWGLWSKCTMSCGGGIQSRSRTCTNPRPSPHGKYCVGDPLEVVSCNRNTCTPNIVFNARTLVDLSPSDGQTMIFSTTLVNEGHAYNTSTGIFRAPVNGLYSFSTEFCISPSNSLYIAIVVDGVPYATARLYEKLSDPCNTAVATAPLRANAEVWVKCTATSSGEIIYSDDKYHINFFSGYLIH